MLWCGRCCNKICLIKEQQPQQINRVWKTLSRTPTTKQQNQQRRVLSWPTSKNNFHSLQRISQGRGRSSLFTNIIESDLKDEWKKSYQSQKKLIKSNWNMCMVWHSIRMATSRRSNNKKCVKEERGLGKSDILKPFKQTLLYQPTRKLYFHCCTA